MDEKLWLVVQYPLKSIRGNKRDYWLKDKVMDYLEIFLHDAELGYVDGFDMGRSKTNPNRFVLNIFCVVTHEKRSITLVKKVLRDYRLDYTKIKIATMAYEN